MTGPVRDHDVVAELHDVFQVTQLTRDTELESLVGVDHVAMDPGQTSQIHRHNCAETVLYITSGSGTVVVEDVDHDVADGDRIRIRPGQYHGVRTGAAPLTFISVQSPPILDKSAGTLDLEPRGG